MEELEPFDFDDHYILCGAGRTGFNIIERFYEMDLPFVVVEQSERTIKFLQKYAGARRLTMHIVPGDATNDAVLEQAGVQYARGLITALSDDKENLFTILTARGLNPRLRIITRVSDVKHNREKLLKAGANKVISTDTIGAMRIASEMIRPEVVKFLDQMLQVTEKEKTLRFIELSLDDIKTPKLAELIKASRAGGEDEDAPKLQIKHIGMHTGLLVLAVKSPEDDDEDDSDLYRIRRRYRFTPRGDVELHVGDVLMVIGTQDKLDEVTGKAAPAA